MKMVETKTTMQKTKLATAVSAALSIMAGQASAQQAGEGLEEVVVTGIRGSLLAAMDVKRESSGVVDAISAEDIGKFPDTNLAESLQRVTGVSINRVEGEGSEVTIRGFSGDFNIVTLNGRQMPAADARGVFFGINANIRTGDSRSFDFSNLASEGVSGLQVYKSGRAGVPSGGLGGTINIETIQPLESANQFSIGAKALSDSGGGTTPEISGLGNWTNDEGTFGLSAFGSVQEREFSNRTALHNSGRGIVWQFPFNPNIPAFANANLVNAPGPDQLAGFPHSAALAFSESSRERTNAALTLQWAPSDRMTVTADGLFARNDQFAKSASDLPFWVRQFDFVAFNGNPVLSQPDFLSEPLVSGGGSDFSQAGKELPFRNSLFAMRDELTSFGLNVDYQLNDSLTLNFDAAHGNAVAKGNHPSGALIEGTSLGGQAVAAHIVDYRTEIPNVAQAIADGSGPSTTMVGGREVTFPGGNANGIFEKSDLGLQYIIQEFGTQDTVIDQAKMAVAFDNGGPVTANFGAGFVSHEMHSVYERYRDEIGGWNTGFIGDIATLMGEEVIEDVCISCQFEDHNNQFLTADELVRDFTAAGGTVAPGASLRLVGQEAFFIDPLAVAEAFDGFVNGGGAQYDYNNRSTVSIADNVITEDVVSLYGEGVLDGEVGGRPMQVVVGLRWEQTDVESVTLQSVPMFKKWTSDNDLATVFSSDVQAVSQTFDYDNLLPSLDFSVDVNDNLKARASFSTTIARAPYNNMFVTTNAGNPSTATYLGGVATGSRGNAQLEPLESDNFDLSLEWYYGEGSAFTVAFFDKSVKNFIGNEQVTTNLFGLRDVTNGAPGTRLGQAIDALNAHTKADGTSAGLTETNLFTMTALIDNDACLENVVFQAGPNAGNTVAGSGSMGFIDPDDDGGAALSSDIATACDIEPNSNDPLMNFVVQQPTNQASANIQGLELNWVHFFTGNLNGFGFQANSTFVDGDIGYDVLANPHTEDQFALTGLSDSWNLMGFYENERFSVRLHYNNRGEFLANTNVSQRIPRFVDEFSQLDFSASYAATDNLTIFLEGINLLDEPIVFRGRTDQQFQSFQEGDMRLYLGARYLFAR